MLRLNSEPDKVSGRCRLCCASAVLKLKYKNATKALNRICIMIGSCYVWCKISYLVVAHLYRMLQEGLLDLKSYGGQTGFSNPEAKIY